MEASPVDVMRLAVRESDRAARLIHRAREARLAGDRMPLAPRAEIGDSWNRVLRSGIDPEKSTHSVLLEPDEIEHRRRSSALGEVMPLLGDALTAIADASQQIMVVTDVEGRVLWRQGNTGVLRRADDICLAEGAAWSEESTGTNAIGTAIAARAPVQVHSAEHFVRSLHGWTCAAAPVRDPRDGRIDGDRRHQRTRVHLPSDDARPGRFGGPAGGERDQDPAPGVHRPAALGGGADAVAGWAAGRWPWTATAGWRRSPGCRRWTGCRCRSPCGRAGCGCPRSGCAGWSRCRGAGWCRWRTARWTARRAGSCST